MKKIALMCFLILFGLLSTVNSTVAEGTPIYDTDFTLGAREYMNYSLSVLVAPAYAQIEISCDGPIQVLIFNATEAQKWTDGQTAWGFAYHNITNLDLIHKFNTVDLWYIYIYNRYTETSSRTGHIIISEVAGYLSTGVLFDQSYSLNAKKYTSFAFWVYDSPTILHLEVTSDDPIQILIFNETEAMKWYNGKTAWGYIYHNVTNLDLYQTFSEYDIWYIFLYNRYSDVTTAEGVFTATKVTDRPSTAEMFDQDFSVDPKAQSSYAFWTYESPYILHIELVAENPVQLLMFNKTEAMNWINGELATGYIFYNITNLDLYHQLTTYNMWYIFVYNRYSSLSSATGHIRVTKVLERPSSGVMFDQDFSLGLHYYSTFTFWVYDSPTYLQIDLNSNNNLLVLLLNETETQKWLSGDPAWSYQFQVRDALIMNQILTNYDVWYLILYNRDTLSTVSGHIRLTKTSTFQGPSIDQAAQITYEEGTTGFTLTWHPCDDNPASYTIYQNGVLLHSRPWDGAAISITVDGLLIGEYNYTLVVFDGNGNSISDSTWVVVTPKSTSATSTTTTSTTTTSEGLSTTSTTSSISPEITPSFAFSSILLLLTLAVYNRKRKKNYSR